MTEFSLSALEAGGLISPLAVPAELRSLLLAIWSVDLRAAAAPTIPWGGLLALDELARANRFVFGEHREKFVASRGALRLILGRYTRLDPARIQFRYSPKDKPFLAHTPESGLRFNLSHSGDLTLIAVAQDRDVGIDVEQARRERDLRDIAGTFFARAEQDLLDKLPIEEQTQAFYQIWTRKEAILKATGEGITSGLKLPDVSHCLKARGVLPVSDGQRGCWLVHGFTPTPGYEAAVAIGSADTRTESTLDRS